MADAKAQLHEDRMIRRRQFKNKEDLKAKPRMQCTTIALNNLAEQQTVMGVGDLKAYVREGTSLLYLGSILGNHSLATFPWTVVRPHEFVLDFKAASSCFKSLSNPIHPIE